MRLYQTVGGGVTTRFGYDGQDLIAEYNAAGVLQRRYVHGPNSDEPLVWYEGSTLTDRRWLHADERGSVIAVTNGTGAMLSINKYDEFGIPQAGNMGRFGYTGQAWLPEIGMNYYKARIYSPSLGRFLQTDPIGYGDGMNMYNYVGSDPVNKVDPSGLATICWQVVTPGRTVNQYDESGNLIGWTNTGGSSSNQCANIDIPGAPNGGFAPRGGGGGATQPNGFDDPCSGPLSGTANAGQTVNSRRAQVRRELRAAFASWTAVALGVGGIWAREAGRNATRLAPNVGTWIRGGTSRDDGNYLYGAVTAELGIHLSIALGVGDVDEVVDDALDRVGLGNEPDESFGRDSPQAQTQIARGARCPG